MYTAIQSAIAVDFTLYKIKLLLLLLKKNMLRNYSQRGKEMAAKSTCISYKVAPGFGNSASYPLSQNGQRTGQHVRYADTPLTHLC